MENEILFVTDGKGNKYVICQEIKEGNKTYYLTKAGVYEKDDSGKCKLSSKEINEKYMALLEPPKVSEYIVVKNEKER